MQRLADRPPRPLTWEEKVAKQQAHWPVLVIAHDVGTSNAELAARIHNDDIRSNASAVRCLAPAHIWSDGVPPLVDGSGKPRTDTCDGVSLTLRTFSGDTVRIVFRDMRKTKWIKTELNHLATCHRQQIQVHINGKVFDLPLFQHTSVGISINKKRILFPSLDFVQRIRAHGQIDVLKMTCYGGFFTHRYGGGRLEDAAKARDDVISDVAYDVCAETRKALLLDEQSPPTVEWASLFRAIERLVHTHTLEQNSLFAIEPLLLAPRAPAQVSASSSSASASPSALCCCCCLEAAPTVLTLPCRHLCLCKPCSTKLASPASCPKCREAISARIDVFL